MTASDYAPWDGQLYLPREWAADGPRRRAAPVPEDMTFPESWRIGRKLRDRSGTDLPLGGVAADAAFGRGTAFRTALPARGGRYGLDVPANTSIRDVGEAPAPGRRRPPGRRVDEWAKAQPAWR